VNILAQNNNLFFPKPVFNTRIKGVLTISGQGRGKIQSAKAFNAKYGSSLKLNCFLSQKPLKKKKKRKGLHRTQSVFDLKAAK